MIDEVDESIRRLVQRDALNGSGVELSFEAPTKEWASRRNTPTISVYLYDVREDLERREVSFEEIRGELKPSLDLVVSAPFDTARVRAAGPPVLEELRVELTERERNGAAETVGGGRRA